MKANKRYQAATEQKAGGATYTPKILADFVADQIVNSFHLSQQRICILDPAIGDGELLVSLLAKMTARTSAALAVFGFDTDKDALSQARSRLASEFPNAELHLEAANFLDFVIDRMRPSLLPSAMSSAPGKFDVIIANPPYVRTQIMGSGKAQALAEAFGLGGRVDLYHAFLIGMAQVLRPGGLAGIIVSNRFMTTKGGGSLRSGLRARFALRHVWDLGDTKLFAAAVLPAVILAEGRDAQELGQPGFTSIYETDQPATLAAMDAVKALTMAGTVALSNGRRFRVQHGLLAGGGREDIWRIATTKTDAWLATVAERTWAAFGAVGKIRVGVKTCADKVFVRSDWDAVPEGRRPELLHALTTHHVAGRYRPIAAKTPRTILYPHESVNGQRRPVDLSVYPKSLAYLEANRATLEARTYVMEAGRRWYEIWVPQDPAAWPAPKLVFRDISERPTFWIDLHGSIVNGDCYWLIAERPGTEDLLWLAAAVANSSFIEAFYDHKFNNKLYARRRRFMTQYVEQFPLPDPATNLARAIIANAKAIYASASGAKTAEIEAQVNRAVWQAFGLDFEEISR